MKIREKKNRMESLTVLFIFAVFAFCVLLLILTGAGIYREVTEKNAINYEWRTRVQYLTTRIRQADSNGSLQIGKFGENDAVILSEELDGEIYYTYVYCYDGYLRELFTAADSGLQPGDGDRILKAQEMKAEKKDHILEIEIRAEDGSNRSLKLFLRSGNTFREGTS